VDPDSGEWLNHEVCTLPSLVIVRSIYTLEEAARREAEEKEMDDALVRIGERVLEFLATKVRRRTVVIDKRETYGKEGRMEDMGAHQGYDGLPPQEALLIRLLCMCGAGGP
jgi:hypothetical protein